MANTAKMKAQTLVRNEHVLGRSWPYIYLISKATQRILIESDILSLL
jgi:hypothetical protein